MMENTLYILAVGHEKAILAVVERLINAHSGWSATTAGTIEEAEQTFATKPFSIVLICAGFPQDQEEVLRQRLPRINPAITIIRHYGGGSGLLENEILTILQKK